MLSSRNEWIAVGVLIVYLAFIPSLQIVRELLSTPIGKAAALAAIVYVHKYVSCPVALLLVIAYLRCSRSIREMLENPPTAPPQTTSSPPISMPPSPPESSQGAPVTTPPPNASMSTAPMTTPMPTMPPPMMPPNTSGGVQPSMGSSSSVAPV
jgi:hypothetical protein